MSDKMNCFSGKLDEVIAECIRAEEAGEPVDRDTLLAAHPDLADDLREFFADRNRLRQLAGGMKGWSRQRPFVPPKVRYFGDYELVEEIARGGMGVVYKARQTSLNRIVAVKTILSGHLAEADDVKRFQSEAEAAASLTHPGIVVVHEVGLHHGRHYFSMDYIEGPSLAELVREHPLPARRAAGYVRSIAEAVHYAHKQGVLHRDLKPSNILLDADDQVHVTDFGLARRVEEDSTLTRTGQILGTPSYLAPEQAAGKRPLIGPASDVYSLGVILYELLTGRPPFQSDSPVETIRQVLDTEPVSPRMLNPQIPRDLATICLKCLEKEPYKRYGTAELLADDLQRFLNGEPILARPISRLARIARWCKRKPAAAALVAVTIAASTAIVAGLVVSNALVAAALEDRTLALNKLQIEQRNVRTALEQRTGALRKLAGEEQKAQAALTAKTQAIAELTTSSSRLDAALQRERRSAYFNSIHLAQREWLAGNLARAANLLDQCPQGLRHFEWRYLKGLCTTPSLLTLTGSPGGRYLQVTADGSTLALSAREAKTDRIQLVDLNTGSVLREIDPGRRGGSLAISADGRLLATAFSLNQDGHRKADISVWDVASGREVHKLTMPNVSISSLAINSDATQLAAGVTVWQPDRPTTSQYELRLWTVGSDASWSHLSPERNPVSSRPIATFSPDDSLLATLHFGDVIVWDAHSKVELFRCQGDSFGNAPVFCGESRLLAASSANMTTICNARNGEVVRRFFHDERNTTCVAFTPDREELIYGTANGKIVRLRIADGQSTVLYRTGQRIAHSYCTPDATRIVTSTNGQSECRVWSLQSNQEYREAGNANTSYFNAAFSPDGRRLVAPATDGERHSVRVSDVGTGEVEHEFAWEGGPVCAVSFAPQGRYLAAAGGEGARLWDLGTGQLVYTLAHSKSAFATRVAFSHDGKRLAVAHAGGATIYELESGKEVRSFAANQRQWFSTAIFTRDDQELFTTGQDGIPRYWNIETGTSRELQQRRRFLHTAVHSPDGKHIAICGQGAAILDAATGETVTVLDGHTGRVHTLDYSSDGQRLATASADGTIKIWDAATGQELLTLEGHTGGALSAAFSPDSQRLVSTGIDGTVRLWHAPAEAPAIADRLGGRVPVPP